MNTQLLRQSRDFQQFMARVQELGKDASESIKVESDLIKIGRLQGRLLALDDVATLLDQIEAEEAIEGTE